jgi:hypothetical protein
VLVQYRTNRAVVIIKVTVPQSSSATAYQTCPEDYPMSCYVSQELELQSMPPSRAALRAVASLHRVKTLTIGPPDMEVSCMLGYCLPCSPVQIAAPCQLQG